MKNVSSYFTKDRFFVWALKIELFKRYKIAFAPVLQLEINFSFFMLQKHYSARLSFLWKKYFVNYVCKPCASSLRSTLQASSSNMIVNHSYVFFNFQRFSHFFIKRAKMRLQDSCIYSTRIRPIKQISARPTKAHIQSWKAIHQY